MDVDLQPVNSLHIGTYVRLLDVIKEFSSSVYNIGSPIVVPFSYHGNLFTLVAEPGTHVNIVIRKLGLSGDVSTTISLIAVTNMDTIVLPLGEGSNIVEVTPEGGGKTEFFVSALHLASLMEANAQEVFNNIELLTDEVENAIFSPIGARLVEFHIPIHDLLPDVITYRKLCTKLAIRSVLQDPGTERGVKDFLTAITANTPIFDRERLDDTEFDPIEYPIFTPQEHFGGWDAHIWLSNRCAASWVAFIKLMNNVDCFKLEQVTEIITTHQEYAEYVVEGGGLNAARIVEIDGGGTGYSLGDLLTVAGGIFSFPAVLSVDSVSTLGVIETVSINDGGAYIQRTVNPVSVTGGTGASATFNLEFSGIGAEIQEKGTGYTVGDVLTVIEGVANAPTMITVLAIEPFPALGSVGFITEISLHNPGSYKAKPEGPVTVTGGTGTGAEFNLTFTENPGRTVRHQFADNFDATDCSLEDLIVTCFDDIKAFMVMDVQTAGKLCIGYPLDTEVEYCNALGLRYLDCDVELDIALLDTVEAEDPTGDGFVGYGLAQRMDGGFCFDSYPPVLMPMPVAWDDCCWIYGHAVTPLIINYGEQQIDVDIVIDVSLLEALAGLGPLLSEV